MMYKTGKQELERQNKDLRIRLENQKAKQELAEAALQAEIASLKADFSKMPDQIAMLQSHIAKSEGTIAEQKEEISSLKKENSTLKELYEKAQLRVAKLLARLKKDSSTSDKPPSSDLFKKPKPQSLREKSGKKPGGQPGHAGRTLRLFPDPTQIVDRVPETCAHCGHSSLAPTGEYTARQKVDIEIKVNIIEERAQECACPNCGNTAAGDFSDDFRNPVHYGDNLKAIVALISEHGFVSVSKTAEIISSLTSGAINLSWGTVVNMQRELSRKLDETIDTIWAGLIAGKVLSADESGCRVNGSLSWVQVFCNESFALFYVNAKRGDIDSNFGILAYFVGILIHDHFSSYYRYDTLTHAECNQHILRALKGLAEIFKHSWLAEMSELLKSACHEKNKLMRSGTSAMPAGMIEDFSNRYDAILEKGRLEYEAATEGNEKKESYHVDERRLLARLGEFKEEHLLFLKNFDAPFSNNLSEQSLRKFKNKINVAGCFRSDEGATIFARIASLITTLKKQNRNVFEGIRSVYSGNVPIAPP